jgi:hypothetical protein
VPPQGAAAGHHRGASRTVVKGLAMEFQGNIRLTHPILHLPSLTHHSPPFQALDVIAHLQKNANLPALPHVVPSIQRLHTHPTDTPPSQLSNVRARAGHILARWGLPTQSIVGFAQDFGPLVGYGRPGKASSWGFSGPSEVGALGPLSGANCHSRAWNFGLAQDGRRV